MLNKSKIIAAVVLLLLGLILAIGYPDGGVKNKDVIITRTNEKNIIIPNLTKEGNAKNFLVKNKKVEKQSLKNIEYKDVSENNIVHKIEKKKTVNIVKPKRKVKKIIPKPAKKKIKLIPPPPPANEEEEDEGC